MTKVGKGASIIFIGLVIGNILGLFYEIIIARFLGPDNFGLLQLGISVIVIFGTFARFGFQGALPRFIPFLLERGEKKKVSSTIKFSIKFVVFLGIIAGILLWFSSSIIAIRIFGEPDLVPVLRTFSLFFPLLVLYQIASALIRSFEGSKHKVLLFDIGIRIIRLALFIPFIFIGYLLFGAIFAYALGAIFISSITLLVINRYYFPFLEKEKTRKKTTIKKELLSFSWPLLLTGFSYLFVSKTDKLLLGFFMASSFVGIYSVALMLAGTLKFVHKAFTWIFLPVVSRQVSNKEFNKLESIFKVSSKWMFTITLPLLLFLALFSEEIITFLFGQEYSMAYLSLIILSLGISMNMLTGLTGNILVANGNTKLNLITEIIGGITNVSLNIFLIPLFGIVGAAIGTSVSYFTRNISSLIFVYKKIGIHPFKRNVLNVLLSGFLTVLIFYMLKTRDLFFTWMALNLVAYGLAFLGLFFVFLIVFRSLDDYDKYILKLIFEKLGINL